MNRRTFIASTVSVLAAPLAAESQVSGRVPRVGILGNAPSPIYQNVFEHALRDLGHEDGKNIVIEWRWRRGDVTRLPDLIADLVRLKVDVIWVPDEVYVNAVRKVTSTIPIVFSTVGDPVAVGYAVSLRRPGGMMTGVSSQWYEWTGKRMEILKETIPRAQPVAVLTTPPEVSPALAA
jgi:putative ABC transport system substrate-binding protein